MKSRLFISTRKGLLVANRSSSGWDLSQHHFDGIPVTLTYEDPRSGTWWAMLDHGHWGVKLHRSTNQGADWEEVPAPAYPEGFEIKEGVPASSKYIWAMQHGGQRYPGRLWVGTIPGGLFRSDDNGASFQLMESLWNDPHRQDHWFGGGFDHPGIHSIVVDPRDEDHVYIGISCAGVLETRDGGNKWEYRNDGLRADFLPDPHAAVGHDPHLLVAAPSNPDIMWQQNHCGIFRSTNGGQQWEDVSQEGGPANFGFAIAVADDNPDQAWVAPAVSDVKRVAIDKALCICRTDDGGKSWKDLRKGLPQEFCFDIVYRHALVASGDDVIFGTTTGNLFFSTNRGDEWQSLNHFLAPVYALSFAD